MLIVTKRYQKQKSAVLHQSKQMSSWNISDSGGEISCSIEETNRIRASLGLKPLRDTPPASSSSSATAASSSSDTATNVSKSSSETFIDLSASRASADASNAAAARSAKLEREREVEASKSAPSLGEKLVAMGSAEASSAAEWVQMSRNLAAKASSSGKQSLSSSSGVVQKSNKLLSTAAAAAEEEEEYSSAIGGIHSRKRRREGGLSANYDSKDLAGLRIGHNAQDLTNTLGDNQESDVVLTLRDTQILMKGGEKDGRSLGGSSNIHLADPDGGEDELVNIQALDRERVSSRLEREKKSKLPVYSSVDELSKKKTGLLSQYDDEVDENGRSLGAGKKGGLVISTEGGIMDTAAEARQRALALKALDDKAQTDLDTSKPQMPTEKTDFYTQAEIAALSAAAKNKKKKKTLRKATGDDIGADPSIDNDGIPVSDSRKIISDIRKQRDLVEIDGIRREEGGAGGGDLGSRAQRRAQAANQTLIDVAAASERGNKAFEAAYEKAALMTKAKLGHVSTSSSAIYSTSGPSAPIRHEQHQSFTTGSSGAAGGWIEAPNDADNSAADKSAIVGSDARTEEPVDPAQLAVRQHLRSAAEAARRSQASNLNTATHQRAYSRLRTTGGAFDDNEGEADDAELQAALSRARRLAVKTDTQPSSSASSSSSNSSSSSLSRAGVFVGGSHHHLGSDNSKSGGGEPSGLLVFNDVSGFSSKMEVQQLMLASELSKSEKVPSSAVPEVALAQPLAEANKQDDMNVEDDVDTHDKKGEDDADDDNDDDDMEIEGEDDNADDDDMDVDDEEERGDDTVGDFFISKKDGDVESSSSRQPRAIQGIAGALQLFQQTGAIRSKNDVQLKGRTKDKRTGNLVVPVAEVGGGTKFHGGGTSGKLDTFVIEYKDEHGKKLTTKEAYRQLSYKFHGKMPSKNVLDRRLKKEKREEQLAKASISELPGSMKALQKAQESKNSAFVFIG